MRRGTPNAIATDGDSIRLHLATGDRILPVIRAERQPSSVLEGQSASRIARRDITAVSEILCPVKAAFRVVVPWSRDDSADLNAEKQFPKPL